MTTVVHARTTIPRVRRRPNGGDKWIKAEFGDQAFKCLNIPEFIDMYKPPYETVLTEQTRSVRTIVRIGKLIEAPNVDYHRLCIVASGAGRGLL
jgi:hypothetical protein